MYISQRVLFRGEKATRNTGVFNKHDGEDRNTALVAGLAAGLVSLIAVFSTL